jgi:hypothetical protein
MPGIKDAIVEILTENPECSAWATGGIHVRRAPPMQQASVERRRDRYIVVRVTDSDPSEWHTQEHPAEGTIDRIEVAVWASSSRDADNGAHFARKALDGMAGTAAGIIVQRILWQGTVDREVEDASGAEQLIDGAIATFEVGYTLPT